MPTNRADTPNRHSAPASISNVHLPGILDENDKKVWILRAATRLFATRGFTGTTVREIVEMAGVTKPTLYYYFKNKEDLFINLMDLAMRIFSDIIDQSLATPGGMRERLINLYTSIYEIFRANTDFLRFMNCTFYGPQGATPPFDLGAAKDSLKTALLEVLRGGIAEGDLLEENLKPIILLLMGLMRNMQEILISDPVNPRLDPSDIALAIGLIFDGPRTLPAGMQP
jgi:TetR/AcrR family transcriptional regulator